MSIVYVQHVFQTLKILFFILDCILGRKMRLDERLRSGLCLQLRVVPDLNQVCNFLIKNVRKCLNWEKLSYAINVMLLLLILQNCWCWNLFNLRKVRSHRYSLDFSSGNFVSYCCFSSVSCFEVFFNMYSSKQ